MDNNTIGCETRCYYCNNRFHNNCINKWKTKMDSCPVCRCKQFTTLTVTPIFGPKLPPNFVFWAGKSRDITEELKIVNSSFNSYTISDDSIPFDDMIQSSDNKSELFISLMINKYGPRIEYRI